MSCKNCSNGCPASEVTGKNCDPVEAEDLVIEFENQSAEQFKIYYHPKIDLWVIGYKYQSGMVATFQLISDAKECAEILKRSV